MACFSMTSLHSALPATRNFHSPAQRPLTLSCFSGFSRPGRLLLSSESCSRSLLSLPQNGCKWTAMRHGNKKAKLGRPADQRKALLRALTTELLRHGKIKTTKVKAKAMRKPVDKMITLAKDGTLHARRQALAYIYDKTIVTSLFAEVPQRYSDRPGGYTRITTDPQLRRGDAAEMATIELV
ncbi:Plastid ribosomal protein L17 large ribosomal subunit [Trebouxia sp. C0009 RCD-2024]